MKCRQLLKSSFFVFCLLSSVYAESPKLPPAMYDEEKVPEFTLPNPLITLDGEKISDVNTWIQKRRPEILKLFETNVYGRTMVGRPDNMTWKVTSENRSDMDGKAISKTVAIYFTGKDDGPKMDVNIVLPADAGKKPVPLVAIVEWAPEKEWLLCRGYGLATFKAEQIEPDSRNGYLKSVRRYFARPDQNEPGPDVWGAIGAWAWGLSRAMDYIVTDKDIDANKVCVAGFSRFGKTAMWAGAQEQRFAIIFSGESGCGGMVLVRRGFGETVKIINNKFPYWFCGNFKTYGDRVNDLPVDWHMLVALMAPRPLYIATAEQDLWGDPRGSFLSAKYAEPVYQLFGKKGLGVDPDFIGMPPLETPVGDFIGYHIRRGGHALTEYDWQQFLNFADRHFGFAKN